MTTRRVRIVRPPGTVSPTAIQVTDAETGAIIPWMDIDFDISRTAAVVAVTVPQGMADDPGVPPTVAPTELNGPAAFGVPLLVRDHPGPGPLCRRLDAIRADTGEHLTNVYRVRLTTAGPASAVEVTYTGGFVYEGEATIVERPWMLNRVPPPGAVPSVAVVRDDNQDGDDGTD